MGVDVEVGHGVLKTLNQGLELVLGHVETRKDGEGVALNVSLHGLDHLDTHVADVGADVGHLVVDKADDIAGVDGVAVDRLRIAHGMGDFTVMHAGQAVGLKANIAEKP